MAARHRRSHHEKWNGTGYPNGSRKDQIPLCGRIVAVADVYDALTSKRVYKKCICGTKWRKDHRKGRRHALRSALVDAFLRVEPAFIAVREQYDEASAIGRSERSSLV